MAKVMSGVCQVVARAKRDLHLSVSCTEITVQFHDSFQICQQHREKAWVKKKGKKLYTAWNIT